MIKHLIKSKKHIEETIRNNTWIVKTSNFEMLTAYTRTENIPSQKLLESCGFEKAGIMHRNFLLDEKIPKDEYYYELTKNKAIN